MFGSGSRANSISNGREGFTKIERPSSGKQTSFGRMRAGDFFTYRGTLYFKINLVDAVEVPNGQECAVGTSQFSESCPVQAERVTITVQ